MTNPITGALNTIAGTASNLVSGLLYDFSIPLGLVNLIQQAIFANQSNPNTPQVQTQRAPREWYSQPSPAVQGTAPTVTVFLLDGTQNVLDLANVPYLPAPDNPVLADLSALIDTSVCTIQQVQWPDALFPLGASVEQGVVALTNAIMSTTGPFILVAYSQGGAVVSSVLEQLQSGTLTGQASRLLFGVTFGSITRQPGKVAPVQTDPGGGGAWGAAQLTTTPTNWWDFALPGDIATTLTNTGLDGDLQQVFQLIIDQFNGGGLIEFLTVTLPTLASFATSPSTVLQLIEWVGGLIGVSAMPAGFPTFAPHGEYHLEAPPGSATTATCVQQAANQINKVADQWQAAYRFVNPTEVLQVNFKLPLSIGQLGFSVLRVPCTLTAWYRDRNNNWIQLTDGANNPISLNVTYSATTSWYQFQSEIYPVIATAMQLRVTRNYDPQMGNAPYVVGVKETLIRRNVYGLNDTTQAIQDQQDILGNVITSYVKDWNPNNAIDNDPNTYWKSFPCPDPNGVVCFYLDTRDQGGNPQLIDTVYIDPVYTGNTLNLYYSNDSTQGTLVINPVNLPPDTQTNAEWKLGTGMFDSSTLGTSNSALTFPTNFGPMVQQPVWIGLEWTPDFAPGAGPPDNPILFGVTPATSTVNAVQTISFLGAPPAVPST
jgi:hypothetical protein